MLAKKLPLKGDIMPEIYIKIREIMSPRCGWNKEIGSKKNIPLIRKKYYPMGGRCVPI